MAEEEDDDVIINDDDGTKGMDEFLDDKFGKSEAKPVVNDAESIDNFLNDKFPTIGAIKRELTIPERFAQYKKRR